MVPLSYLHFPLLKLHCHKLKEKINIKLVRMDTYIDFNDSYIFLTATYIFSYHSEDITVSSKPPTPNSRHFFQLFPSQKLN